MTATPAAVAHAPFRHLDALWVQVTGTLCNLACGHCINSSGPRDPWLPPMDPGLVRRHVEEAAVLGAREIYFTGGEPFLHPEIVPLLAFALARAATTVLTNGTLITERMADRLAVLAAGARYSLEIRVSLDDPDPARNDALRGAGAFARALAALQRLDARGLLPILTATGAGGGDGAHHDRLRAVLEAAGVRRPRIKLLPVFPAGRMAGHGGSAPAPAMLTGVDVGRLYCTSARAVTADGIYACPILAGLPEGHIAASTLAAARGSVPLVHPACQVCWETGATCGNG